MITIVFLMGTILVYDVFLLGVVLALLAGVDGCGLVGAGIDDGACLEELLLEICKAGGGTSSTSLNTKKFLIVLLLFF